jgi:hypothetical protein
MKKTAVGLLLLGLLALPVPATAADGAGGQSSISYDGAQLEIAAPPLTMYTVFGEQPDGLYSIAAVGVTFGGSETVPLIAMGPVDSNPQFIVHLLGGWGDELHFIEDEEGGWGWN